MPGKKARAFTKSGAAIESASAKSDDSALLILRSQKSIGASQRENQAENEYPDPALACDRGAAGSSSGNARKYAKTPGL